MFNALNFTLHKPSAISCAVMGVFSTVLPQNGQQVLLYRGDSLELVVIREGRVEMVSSQVVYATVRSMDVIPLTKAKDGVVVGGDTGRITILRFSEEKKIFQNLVETESFGPFGSLRDVPGQYVSVDSQGRVILTTSVESSKFFIWVDSKRHGRIELSRSEKFGRNSGVIFDVVSIDVARLENAKFATIEVDYSDKKKRLCVYEVYKKRNKPLNIKESRYEIPESSHRLINLPVKYNGLLVCYEDKLSFFDFESEEISFSKNIPRGKFVDETRKILVTSHCHLDSGEQYFLLIQNEVGDLLKVDFLDMDGELEDIRIDYFDTVTLGNHMFLLGQGYLFVCAEFGDHKIFQIQNYDIEETEVVEKSHSETKEMYYIYEPRKDTTHVNLKETFSWKSLSPLLRMDIPDIPTDNRKKLTCLCGSGNRSSFRLLESGITVNTVGQEELRGKDGKPALIRNIFTVETHEEKTKYVVLSLTDSTYLMEIIDNNLKVCNEGIGIEMKKPTIFLGKVTDDVICQVMEDGIRLVQFYQRNILHHKKMEKEKVVIHGCAVEDRCVVATKNEMLAYEIVQNELLEYHHKDIESEVECMCVWNDESNPNSMMFLAYGTNDKTIRIYNLATNSFHEISRTRVSDIPISMTFLDHRQNRRRNNKMLDEEVNNEEEEGYEEVEEDGRKGDLGLYLYIGLSNGAMVIQKVVRSTGELVEDEVVTRLMADTECPVYVSPITLKEPVNRNVVIATSNKSSLCFGQGTSLRVIPINYTPLKYYRRFQTVGTLLIGISKQYFKVVQFRDLGSLGSSKGLTNPISGLTSTDIVGIPWNHHFMRFPYTPREYVLFKEYKAMFIIQTSHGVERRGNDLYRQGPRSRIWVAQLTWIQLYPHPKKTKASPSDATSQGGGTTQQPKNPSQPQKKYEVVVSFPLDKNESAFSMCPGDCIEGSKILCIGSGTRVNLFKNYRHGGVDGESWGESGKLRIFALNFKKRIVTKIHYREYREVPSVVCMFQKGIVLLGIGTSIQFYEVGLSRFSLRCVKKGFVGRINQIRVMRNRLMVSDMSNKIFILTYQKHLNTLYIFAKSVIPRWLTTFIPIEFSTLVGGDKFGNLFFYRLDESKDLMNQPLSDFPVDPGRMMVDEEDEDEEGGDGKPEKEKKRKVKLLKEIASFHLGDIITSIKTVYLRRRAEYLTGMVIVYSTVKGGVGVLLPLYTIKDFDFFMNLEMCLRKYAIDFLVCGGDQMKYRSRYYPSKSIIDGDFCQLFAKLSPDVQEKIGFEMKMQVKDIVKKLMSVTDYLRF